MLLIAATFLLVLNEIASRQVPQGDQYSPPPAVFSKEWWLSPYEFNRFNRQAVPRINASLRAVHFHTEGLRGWAVGDNGAILSTRNGGQTWQTQASGVKSWLRSIAFLTDGLRGWTTGDDGTILATRDGGQTWQVQASGINSPLTSIVFLADGLRGWAVGDNGTILATRDGGQTWQVQTSGIKSSVNSIVFLTDGLRGWAVGDNGTILATRDGGQTWQAQASGVKSWLFSIAFLADGLRGWAVGENSTILATRDGGQTWQAQASGLKSPLTSIAFLADGLRGWAVGDDGTILSTHNSGQTWQVQASGIKSPLTSIAFLADGLRGWVVGNNGAILTTRDGGQTWQVQASGIKSPLTSIAFLADGLHGWAVGDNGTILSTRDGGQTWQVQASGMKSPLTAIAFLADGLRGWAVGNNGAILATRDGGRTWQAQASGIKSPLISITFLADGLRGWTVGDNGTILATRDGGQTWQAQASGVKSWLFSITFLADGLRGWAVGDDGTILATRDGGQTWQTQASGIKSLLTSITFLASGLRGWVAGNNGTILTTRDGGQTWQAQASGVKSWLFSIAFLADGLRGWAVGENSTILATRDGGQTWQTQASGIKSPLTSIALLADGLRGWAVGDDGTILSTHDSGQTWLVQGQYRRYPAPWFVLSCVLMLLASIGLMFGRLKNPAIQELKNRILGAAVDDNPITDVERDRLGFTPVVDALVAFMRHEKTRPPVTFAVTAQWGRGKSSMMQMLHTRLQDQGVPTVWFNAWHHQQEPVLLAPLLETIARQAMPPWWSAHGFNVRFELLLRRFVAKPWLGLGPLVMFLALLLWLVGTVFAAFTPFEAGHPHPSVKLWAATVDWIVSMLMAAPGADALVAGNFGLVATKILGAFVQQPLAAWPAVLFIYVAVSLWLLVFHFLRPFPASPSTLLASIGNKFNLKQAEEQTGFRQRFRQHFHEFCEATQPYTLTIFIDDLDRCEAKKCAEMLEAVNYLADAGKCFVVLGIAKEIVEAQLGEAFKDIAVTHAAFASLANHRESETNDKERKAIQDRKDYARDYLRKLIQIEIPVPRPSKEGFAKLLTQSDIETAGWNITWGQWMRFTRLAFAAVGFCCLIWLIVWSISQIKLWNDIKQTEFKLRIETLQQQLKDTQRRADDIAVYSAWLSFSENDKTSRATDTTLDGAHAKARLAQIQNLQKQIAYGLDELRPHAANGRNQPFTEKLGATIVLLDQAEETRKTDQRWSKLKGPTTKPGKAVATSATAPLVRADAPPNAEKDGPVILQPEPQPDWPYNVGLALVVIIGLFFLWRSKDTYRIEESNDYREALKKWQRVATARPDMRNPREAKRYLNLSRYLTLRINAEKYAWPTPVKTWVGKKLRRLATTQEVSETSEDTIVALTALYLARPRSLVSDGEIAHYMLLPLDALFGKEGDDATVADAIADALDPKTAVGISEHELAAFLGAVGDLAIVNDQVR
ncbi:MAG: YCF48-related protein [Sterolibacteriaceae bacterium MAG5]|nr:YCF48-related protein [Candidatus Nitricoxidireducens bremensis]